MTAVARPANEANPGRRRSLRPRDAATLILLDQSASPPRVLMGKRHSGHAFMPGKFVFPGGRVEPEDRRMGVAAGLHPVVERKLNARVRRPSSSFARAIALAALRETFEETGLVVGLAGCALSGTPPAGAWTRFISTGVWPTLDGIDFVARAITPPGRARRFDARFLVVDAGLIAGRIDGVVHPEAKLVDLVWVPLDRARDLDLPQITRLALDDLSEALARGFEKARSRPFYRELRGKRLREEL